MLDQTARAGFSELLSAIDRLKALDAGDTKQLLRVASRLCTFDGTGRTILAATPIPSISGPPVISVRFAGAINLRHFDTVDFAVLRLLDACCAPCTNQGFTLRAASGHYHGSQYVCLGFGNGKLSAGDCVSVSRIIIDRGGRSVARFAEEKQDYRRRSLIPHARRARRSSHYGRGQAVEIAKDLFAQNFPNGLCGQDAKAVKALLMTLLSLADEQYGTSRRLVLHDSRPRAKPYAFPFDGMAAGLKPNGKAACITIPREYWQSVVGLSDTEIDRDWRGHGLLHRRVHDAFYGWRERRPEFGKLKLVCDERRGTPDTSAGNAGPHLGMKVYMFIPPS